MFDLHLTKNPLNRITGYPVSVKNAFYRYGIPNTTKALSLISAIAAIQPSKSLYIDSVDNCVRIYANIEYRASTFLARLNKLKEHLMFLSAPYLLIVEERPDGTGVDFSLLVKNQYANKENLHLESHSGEHCCVNQLVKNAEEPYAAFGSYSDSISKLRVYRTVSNLNLGLMIGSEVVNLYKQAVDFSPSSDATFIESGLYFKSITFSEATDEVSLEIVRYGDSTMDVRLLSGLEKL